MRRKALHTSISALHSPNCPLDLLTTLVYSLPPPYSCTKIVSCLIHWRAWCDSLSVSISWTGKVSFRTRCLPKPGLPTWERYKRMCNKVNDAEQGVCTLLERGILAVQRGTPVVALPNVDTEV